MVSGESYLQTVVQDDECVDLLEEVLREWFQLIVEGNAQQEIIQ